MGPRSSGCTEQVDQACYIVIFMIVTNSIVEAVTEGKYRKAPTFREFISFLVDTKVSVSVY